VSPSSKIPGSTFGNSFIGLTNEGSLSQMMSSLSCIRIGLSSSIVLSMILQSFIFIYLAPVTTFWLTWSIFLMGSPNLLCLGTFLKSLNKWPSSWAGPACYFLNLAKISSSVGGFFTSFKCIGVTDFILLSKAEFLPPSSTT